MLEIPQWLGWLVPSFYLAGAAATLFLRGDAARWTALSLANRCALVTAVVGCVNMDLSSIVGLLVSFLGWIIGEFSRRYLTGEPGQSRFVVAYQMTLSAVGAVVATDNLAVLIVAWAASSLCLHHLLAFYRDRPAAVLVAHKKFITSRLAEACLVIAAVLLYREVGSLDLDHIAAHAGSAAQVGAGTQVAAALIAVAALVKCAQLPLHGWLIQVMEAPTPVSALLHAGVVNLAGYLLLRLAPLIDASLPAQAILVVVGSLSAAVAGLTLMTRVTIKVRLAWSTCSQMGLMLMECGLGLHDLALLHLVAHALYKAHAFLTAGDTVGAANSAATAGTAASSSTAGLFRPLAALALALLVSTGSSLAWPAAFGGSPLPWIVPVLAALGLAPMLWISAGTGNLAWGRLAAICVGSLLYLAWHGLIASYLGMGPSTPAPVLATFVAIVFFGLYLAQASVFAGSKRVRGSIHDWIYAGLYLDERFTRLTYLAWPPRTPAPASQRRFT